MLNRYYQPVNITVPAGTPSSAPVTVALPTTDWWVYSIHVMIPNGHAGFTGLAVISAGVALVPWGQPVTYLIGNQLDWDFDIGVEVPGPLVFQAYNNDVFQHTFYTRVVYQPMGATVSQPQISAIPIS